MAAVRRGTGDGGKGGVRAHRRYPEAKAGGTGQVNHRCEQAKLSCGAYAPHGLVGAAPRGARGFPGDGWRDRAESGLWDGPDLYYGGADATINLDTHQPRRVVRERG